MKRVDQQVNPVSLVPSLEAELEEAHAHIFENEKRTHRKKLEQFLRKVSEDRRELLGGAESTRRQHRTKHGGADGDYWQSGFASFSVNLLSIPSSSTDSKCYSQISSLETRSTHSENQIRVKFEAVEFEASISCPTYLLHGEIDTGRRQRKRTTLAAGTLDETGVEQDRRERRWKRRHEKLDGVGSETMVKLQVAFHNSLEAEQEE
ncbi:Uncharacterized protein Rs2_34968 [Raphanus sativus]|nr:Uncharacterized protein Rs2_34968 [Raphanus sativus]